MKRMTKRTEQGFTLVELLLAMAFFGSVLMIATLLLTQTLNIYNKGMTVKQMNQVGRTLFEDMIRAGNSGKNISVGMGGTPSQPNCISIDGTTYVWNIADPSPSSTNGGYKTISYSYDSVKKDPVNFIKLKQTGEGAGCASVPAQIERNNASPVIGDNVRVYDVVVTKIANTNLARISMLLGTFDAVGSDYNLYSNGGNWECRPGGIGNFCAKANFDTVLYVPNGEL